jgi:hypothetical protein
MPKKNADRFTATLTNSVHWITLHHRLGKNDPNPAGVIHLRPS